MGINVVRTLPEDQWRCFVEQHPEGNIFHTPEMFQVFSRTKGHCPELWAAASDERLLGLLLPVQITFMHRLVRHFTTRSVVYGSVLCVPDAEGEKALSVLLQSYTNKVEGTPLFTELRNLSNMEAVQPILNRYGFVYEDHLNYLIDLRRAPEAILQSIGRQTRKNIRRGLRRGEVVVEEVEKREDVATCYDLIRQTYRTAGVPLADRSLFEAAFDLLRPKGMARFTLARVGRTPAAVSVELMYRGVMYGWFGGVDRAYGCHVPNELLTWHLFQWGSENGYRVYDFGGAGKPDEEYGVRDFKAKFGGELVCYGRNIYVHSPKLLWLSKKGYQLLCRWV
jgi:hypothetical protein